MRGEALVAKGKDLVHWQKNKKKQKKNISNLNGKIHKWQNGDECRHQKAKSSNLQNYQTIHQKPFVYPKVKDLKNLGYFYLYQRSARSCDETAGRGQPH